MNWGIEDLAAATALIGATVISIGIVFMTMADLLPRGILIAVIVAIALAIWAHLAVGVF